MERIPTLTPITVQDVVLQKSDKPRFDPNTGEEIKNEFVVVIYSTIEQQITSTGRISEQKRLVRQPVSNLTLSEAKDAYPAGKTFDDSQLILVKLQNNQSREWNYFDSQTGKEMSMDIDYDYGVVHPVLYEKQRDRQARLNQFMNERQPQVPAVNEVGAAEE